MLKYRYGAGIRRFLRSRIVERVSWLMILCAVGAYAQTAIVSAQNFVVDPAGLNNGDNSVNGLNFNRIPTIVNGQVVPGSGGAAIASPLDRGDPNFDGLDFYAEGIREMSLTRTGRLGIGTQHPAFNVHLVGPNDVQVALQSGAPGGKLWSIQSSGTVNPARVGTFQIIDRDQNLERLGIDRAGLVSVSALQITGGSDVAEPFGTSAMLPSGAVVVIDERNPGLLRPSAISYDRKVAGIVSGAQGINPGVSLQQLDFGHGHRQQVALAGRVYALADTSNGPIRAGDLLTSSTRAIHAMRVTDLAKAQGAIIGKAMSNLDRGDGYVLVLVSLQ